VKIGIDLGTTTTSVCIGEDRLTSHGPFPTLSAFRNEKWYFGSDAELEADRSEDDLWLMPNLKLDLGLQEKNVGGRIIQPQRVLSDFLRSQLDELGLVAVTEAVLGIPVRFSVAQRRAMSDAAVAAGISKVHLVYEPTAALVGALEGYQLHGGDHVLVVDWGGGTLDVSLVQYQHESFREVLVTGDVNVLGGAKIDQAIANKLLMGNRDMALEVEAKPSGPSRFQALVEHAKRQVLQVGDPYLIEPPWLRCSVALTPELVNEILRDFGARGAERIRTLLAESGVQISAVTHVLYAGGVCRSQTIRQELSRALPGCLELPSSSPQMLTARGCALLSRDGFRLLTSADVVLREGDGQFCTLIPAQRQFEPDAYRGSDLIVTDATDVIARIELGLRPTESSGSAVSLDSGRFRRLGELDVPTGAALRSPLRVPDDLIRLFVGLTSEMCLHAYAVSQRKLSPVEDWFTEIPMSLFIGR